MYVKELCSVPHKYPTSTNEIQKLINILAQQKLSIKEMLSILNLKDRKNFMNNYLNPAITEEFIVMLYPETPRHPKQKYLLTEKGLSFVDVSIMPSKK